MIIGTLTYYAVALLVIALMVQLLPRPAAARQGGRTVRPVPTPVP